MKKISLSKIERQNYVTHSEDGVVDIVAGTALFLVGLLGVLDIDMSSFMFFVYFPLFFLGPALKSAITYPRIGYASFRGTDEMRKKMVIFFSITALLGIIVAMSWPAVSPAINWIANGAQIPIIAMTIIGILIAALAGVSLRVGFNNAITKRYFVYSALFIIAILAIPYAGLQRNLELAPLGLLGLGMLVYGAYCMKKFVEKYPVLEKST